MKNVIRQKSPYLRKKDDYEKDFRIWNSRHARKNHTKNKHRMHRTLRRKVRQTLGQIIQHYIPTQSDAFPSSSLRVYRAKTMQYDATSLRELIDHKRQRRVETLICQNFFKVICEDCGCCRQYYYTPYRSLCIEKKEHFKNFLRSLIENQHGYAEMIAKYFFRSLYEVVRSWDYYHQRIKLRLDEFFRCEPPWKAEILNWVLSHQKNNF